MEEGSNKEQWWCTINGHSRVTEAEKEKKKGFKNYIELIRFRFLDEKNGSFFFCGERKLSRRKERKMEGKDFVKWWRDHHHPKPIISFIGPPFDLPNSSENIFSALSLFPLSFFLGSFIRKKKASHFFSYLALLSFIPKFPSSILSIFPLILLLGFFFFDGFLLSFPQTNWFTEVGLIRIEGIMNRLWDSLSGNFTFWLLF